MTWLTHDFHCGSSLEVPGWYWEVCEFSRTEAKEEETVRKWGAGCTGRADEIKKVFVDRITRSGKSTEIKAKPKRNRKHMKLAERRTKPHPVRHRSRPILNNYSNSLTLKSGCIFAEVPPTLQVSLLLSFFTQISPDNSQSLPSFIYVGSYFMAFVYSIPIVINDQREALHPGDDPAHYLYRDAEHHMET